MNGPETTEDRWLGGRLKLHQPADSYRVAIDAAFLAAAVPALLGQQRLLELGTGVGAGALAAALRAPQAVIDAVELQPSLARLAQANVLANSLGGRVRILAADVAALPTPRQAYDAVFFNPPYLRSDANHASDDPIRRIATVEGSAGLDIWIAAAASAARPGGWIVLIHRADRLADILAGFAAAAIGGATVFPLWPKPGVAARRIVVRGRARRGGRLTLAAGMVLHQPDGAFTPAAADILAGRSVLDL